MFKQRLFSHKRVVTCAAILMLSGAISIRASAADNKMFADGVIERHANWLQYKAYTPDDELNPIPSAAGNGMIQDDAGFIWLAVYSSGLIRYDGHTMELYGTDAGLPSLLLSGLVLGPRKHLWVSTRSGLVMSEEPLSVASSTESISFAGSHSGVSLSTGNFDQPPLVRAGGIWVIEPDVHKLHAYEWGDNGALKASEHAFDSTITGRINYFASIDETSFVLSGPAGLWLFDSNTAALKPLSRPRSCKVPMNVHTGTRGQALLLCESGLVFGAPGWKAWDENREVFRGQDRARNATFTNGGDATLHAHGGGFAMFDRNLNLAQVVESKTFKVSSVMDSLLDREGNLWLSSTHGFRKMNPLREAFSGVVYRKDDVVFGVTSFDVIKGTGALLLGGRQGLLWLQGDKEVLLNLDDGLPVDRVYAVRSTPLGVVLAHARHYSVLKPVGTVRPRGLGNWKKIDILGQAYEIASVSNRATDIAQFKINGRDVVCIVGMGELVCLSERDIPRRWTQKHAVPMAATETAQTLDGFLWISAGSSGIKRSVVPFEDAFDLPVNQPLFEELSSWSEKDPAGKSIPVDGLIPIPSGLVLCTEQGLRILTVREGEVMKVTSLTQKDGLAGNYMVSGSYNAQTKLLYVAGNRGISAIDLETNEVVWSVGKRQGLLDDELSWNSSLLSSTGGTLYMATPKGLAIHNPNGLQPNTLRPSPVWRALRFERDDNGYNEMNAVFSALSFTNELKTKYKSRVLGYSDWSEPTSENRLRLMNLPAFFFSKEYTLEVLAANDSGVWSEEPLRHSFTVKPAWWLRWYTLGLLALIVAAIVFTLRRQKFEAILERDKAERYAADADAKSKALKETFDQLDEELKKRETLQAKNADLQRDNEIAAQQLVQADKLATMGTMVAGVAHDIANPTGLARSSLDLSADARRQFETFLFDLIPDDGGTETKAVLEEVHRFFKTHAEHEQDMALAVERIADINEAIRNQARVDQAVSLVNVRTLISECLTITKSRLIGIDVTVDCDSALEAMLVRSQFGQVLMNLLANASDAIREHSAEGSITISVTNSEPEGFVLTLEDSGPGIPQDLRPKILEPFFTTKDVGKGTGLGMPIVLRILEMHGLTLLIDDSERHGGAKMVIRPRVSS